MVIINGIGYLAVSCDTAMELREHGYRILAYDQDTTELWYLDSTVNIVEAFTTGNCILLYKLPELSEFTD